MLQELLKDDNQLKIGWNFGICPSGIYFGGYNMLNDPIFIFGTGKDLNIHDYIEWTNFGCDHQIAGAISVSGTTPISSLQFTIGPYGSYTSITTTYFDFYNYSLDPNAVITVHYYTHLHDDYVRLPTATTNPVDGTVIPSLTRIQISD
jgi:hypothetical protein